MRIFSLKKFLFLSLFLALALFLTPAVHADSSIECQQQTLSVTLSPTDPTTYHIVGWYCADPKNTPTTVQVLVPGSTYGHLYWDFPYQPQHYSYVAEAVKAGYAVFNFDRLGIGLSDHPVDTLVTTDAHAYIVHQIIQDLQNGTISPIHFSHIVLVGHSYGSMISIDETATYHDAQAVVLTGFLHNVSPAGQSAFANFYPASLDPRFAGEGLTPGYITSMPGTRGSLFYYLLNADPTVISTDEATKETTTLSEFITGGPIIASNISQQITVPVLNVVGEFDNLFCGGAVDCTNYNAVVNYEAPFYSQQAQYQLNIIPDSGHVINLQTNAQVPYTNITHWLDQQFSK